MPLVFALMPRRPFRVNRHNVGVPCDTAVVLQVSVFVVNLKGRPFMGGLSENKPLLYSLAATFALTFMSASETIPRVSSADQDPYFHARLHDLARVPFLRLHC